MTEQRNLKILIVSSEVNPYAKSGGLGDVVGSLPAELKKHGVDARVVFPKYGAIPKQYLSEAKYVCSFATSMGWRNHNATVIQIKGDEDVPFYLIENDYFFGRDGLYGYGDDYERFAFFSKTAVEFLAYTDFQPDIIHFNDWQTGLGCVYLKDVFKRFLYYSNMKCLFTVHNLQYQGVFGRGILDAIDLNDGYFTGDKLEFYGNISYMKAGLVYADAVSTVSETYAQEIQTSDYGYGMDGVLRSRAHDLYGIVNGIDYKSNDPAKDKRIYALYNKDQLDIKKENKTALQRELGLPEGDAPIIALVSRLAGQKGLDLMGVAMEELMQMGLQMVVLGTGESQYENMFRHYAWKYPDKLSANILFNAELAQKIYAGSDMFLMPSLFEPCGLGQMFAMRYGTVPIVRHTGGLADTVRHYNYGDRTGNGFVFNNYDAQGMMWAVKEALHCYYNCKEDWRQVVRNGMDSDFSWDASAKKYIGLYETLREKY